MSEILQQDHRSIRGSSTIGSQAKSRRLTFSRDTHAKNGIERGAKLENQETLRI